MTFIIKQNMHISLTFFTNEQDFLIQQAELQLD